MKHITKYNLTINKLKSIGDKLTFAGLINNKLFYGYMKIRKDDKEEEDYRIMINDFTKAEYKYTKNKIKALIEGTK